MSLKSKGKAEIGLKSPDFLQSKKLLKDILYHMKPIESSQSCKTCHGDRKILGIIEVKYDLSEVILLNKIKWIWVMVILIIAIALFLGAVIVNRLVFYPLKKIFSLFDDPELRGFPVKEKNFEIKNLQGIITELKTEIKYKEKLEKMNRELHHSLKELESTNKALHLVSQETKKRLHLMETNIGRLKKTGDIMSMLFDKNDTEEIMKNFIMYIVDIVLAERGVIYLRINSNDFIFHYIRNYGFNPEISQQDKDLLSRILKNRLTILDVHPLSGRQIIGLPVRLRESLIGCLMLEGAFSQQDMEIMTVFSNHLSIALKNIQNFEKFTKGYISVIDVIIGDILEENRFYRKGRVMRLKRLSIEIGKLLGLSSKELETLTQASVLLDIGKLRIPYRIFNKKGPLTLEEFNILKMHPLKGAELFDGTIFYDLRTVILQHHERYDGTGYPEGIAGEDIDIKARIISLADAFEAMMSDRPYRSALSFEGTLKEIEKTAGRQFDPNVVKRFFDVVNENPSIFIETGYKIP